MIGRAAAIGYPILSDSDTKSQGQAKTEPVAVALACEVDLSAVDGKVRALCDSIRQVPPEDTAAVKAALTGIVEDLDRREAEPTAQNEDVNAQTVNAARLQAMGAYTKAKDES